LMSRQIGALTAIGVATLDSVEKIGCRAATSTSNVAESIIMSIGGLFRRLIVAAGEGAPTVLEQIDETTQHVGDNGREPFERTLDSASSVGEASARFAERVAIRSLDAGSEVGGALRAALWRDGAPSIADRPVAPSAGEHARVAS